MGRLPSPWDAARRAAVALLVALAAAGCATHEGGTPGAFSRALDEAASAAASGALVVELAAGGRAPDALLDTALGDAIADARTAQNAIATRQVTDGADADAQQEAMAAVAAAHAALVDARAWATGARADDADPVLAALRAAVEDLTALADDLADQAGPGGAS